MSPSISRSVEIVEVGPRDGLQSEPGVVPTATKVEFIERLIDSGIRRVEVTSFVNPKKVPQMADAEQVLAGLQRREGVTHTEPFQGQSTPKKATLGWLF